MNTTNIFVELVVIGFHTLIGISIFVLAQFGYQNADTEKLLTINLALPVLATAYILGILIDRVSDRIFRAQDYKMRPSGSEANLPPFLTMRFYILHKSSDIYAQLEYIRSRLRIARASVFNFILMTIAVLVAMGRFNHEVIAVHPGTSIVYQTEDRHDGCLYRFIPNVPGKLAEGGKLQVLVVRDKLHIDTRNWIFTGIEPGTKHAVSWLDMDDVEAPDDGLRARATAAGAATFARGEGIWYGRDEVFFACTNGGIEKQGQIFRYTPSPYEGTAEEKNHPPTLDLYLEPNNVNLLRNCDNLTIAPWGDVVFCEDNDSPRIIGVTPQGKMYIIAHNVFHPSEFAGVVFSPSGKTLFVNILRMAKITSSRSFPTELHALEQPSIPIK